ncbi:hypothetical protein CB1_000931081 [Camelus ferus]|nr:hypothetical protein CB1_000931081 [Camelus ferus]
MEDGTKPKNTSSTSKCLGVETVSKQAMCCTRHRYQGPDNRRCCPEAQKDEVHLTWSILMAKNQLFHDNFPRINLWRSAFLPSKAGLLSLAVKFKNP